VIWKNAPTCGSTVEIQGNETKSYKPVGMEWISVIAKKPNRNGHVLLLERNGDHLLVDIGIFQPTRNEWCVLIRNREVCNVTHWMPLPEPPKTKDNHNLDTSLGTNFEEIIDGFPVVNKPPKE